MSPAKNRISINSLPFLTIQLSASRKTRIVLRLRFAMPSPEALHHQMIVFALAKGRFEEAVWLTINHINPEITKVIYGRIVKADYQGFIAFIRNLVAMATRLASDGEATTPEELRKIIFTVAKTLGFHHTTLTYWRDRPYIVRKDKLDIDGDPVRIPVFDGEMDSYEQSKHAITPEDEAIGHELLALIMKGCRVLTMLERQVFVLCRRYRFEFQKRHGMFAYVGRFAVLDRAGNIIRFRSWHTKPSKVASRKVISLITKLYQRACQKIQRFGDDHGYPYLVD